MCFVGRGERYDDIIKEMCLPETKQMRQTLVRIKNRLAWKDISKDYKFDSAKIQYTKTQLDTISKLPQIRKLLKEGKLNDHAIVDVVWGKSLTKAQRETKSQTVAKIRKNKIFVGIK